MLNNVWKIYKIVLNVENNGEKSMKKFQKLSENKTKPKSGILILIPFFHKLKLSYKDALN